MIFTFITVLAYIGAAAGTLAWLFCGWMNHEYRKETNLQKLVDQMDGVKRTWPVGYCLLIATLSWAWLVTTWVS